MGSEKGIRAGMKVAMALFLTGVTIGGGAVWAQTQEPAKPAAGTEQAVPTGNVIRTESRVVLVDAVVTDKKGHYITDLTQGEFKVYEDNKEQAITSFSSGSDPAIQAAGQKHYMILFFDNSSMETADQMQARNAATKFIESNSGAQQLMAVVNFGGSLVIRQNFTANATLLKAAVSGIAAPNIETNGQTSQPVMVASLGMPSLSNAEADFGARSMLLSIRSLAKNLRSVPGRKMLILFTAGFPLSVENTSELTATIDACNKANVAVYPLDVRGLVSGAPPMGSARVAPRAKEANANVAAARHEAPGMRPRLVLASYKAEALLEPQKPGGGGAGGGTGGGGGHGGGG
ncbi:MAG: VWA domain-containing protein, partial [Candidatus Acidiferrum sp.]